MISAATYLMELLKNTLKEKFEDSVQSILQK